MRAQPSVFVNPAAETIRRVRAESILGQPVLLCHPQYARARVERALRHLRTGPKSYQRMVTDQEKGRYYENIYAPLRDRETNAYLGTVLISRDVTEKKLMEEERVRHMEEVEEKLKALNQRLHTVFLATIDSLVNALEAKDPYTRGHSERVARTAGRVAEYAYGISRESKEVYLAGRLHDLGKVGVRETVLGKPGPLTDEELEHIKEHPIKGQQILSQLDWLQSVALAVRHHHERFDGQGYPDGLKGEQIPTASRILALADSYDAMTSDRPYRPARSAEEAAGEIARNAGTQFDPEWTQVFLELLYSGSIG